MNSLLSTLHSQLFRLPVLKFTVQEESMLPTLKPGDTVLVWRFGNPKAGNIAVAHPKGVPIIKRVTKVRGDQYFLIGDNEKSSIDSRQFGWIGRSQILGTVFHKI